MIRLPSVVVDTNIFISALISKGNCAEILDLWSRKEFQLYLNQEIIDEIEAVGKRPIFRKYFSIAQLETLISLIKKQSTLTPFMTIPLKYVSQDPKDNILVSCVLATKASYLVTGNAKDFTQIDSITKVISPGEFISLLKENTT